MYTLQNRWKMQEGHLYYYGMRNAPYTLHNTLKCSHRQAGVIQRLPQLLNEHEQTLLKTFIEEGIIVKTEHLKVTPKSLETSTFCVSCVANDFMIPGLEFDERGQCAMCQNAAITSKFKSVLPIKNTFERSQKSRFDLALFYTGGKDSSFLLYYLAKKLDLRVLALTWEIPFMSESAKASIEEAKKHLPNVEFVSRKMNDTELRSIYKDLYHRAGNTCACPSLAYLLFFPDLVHERIPYFVAGNEPVQMLNLYFNRFAPKIAFSERAHKWMLRGVNVLRLFTLRKPLKMGQMQTLLTMKQLAFGDPFIKKWSSYDHEILKNILTAFETSPWLRQPLKRSVRYASRTGRVPAFVHIDFNDIEDGHYDWKKVKRLITKEIGWVGPKDSDKGLHTSCSIEKCKDYTQFMRFYHMESQMIPFSAIEMSLASKANHLDKQTAIEEIKNHLGFSLTPPKACQIMEEYLNHQ